MVRAINPRLYRAHRTAEWFLTGSRQPSRVLMQAAANGMAKAILEALEEGRWRIS